MPVDISIINASGQDSKELKALEEFLLPKFQEYFRAHSDVSGKLAFYPNNIIFHGPTKDVDILMVGDFSNFFIDFEGRRVRIERICTSIEAKSHNADSVYSVGQNLYVVYPEKNENVTIQRKRQLDLLTNFLGKAGVLPYITALIWCYGLSDEELQTKAPQANNAFALDSSVEQIMQLIAAQGYLADYNAFVNCMKNNDSFFEDLKRVFSGIRKGKSLNTIKSLNLFSTEKGKQLFDKAFSNDSLSVYSGRAGTGKTISLLQLATYISSELNQKCLFLTYNVALVSDIKRMLSFAPFVCRTNIIIQSVQKYYRDYMLMTGVWEEQGNDGSFDDIYNERLRKLISDASITTPDLGYDYVFVDEAQDWTTEERDLLIRQFGKDKIVVADGLDQFMRSSKKTDWGASTERLTVSLRQKTNIIHFVNQYSQCFNLGWHVEPNDSFAGGKVIISKTYTSARHLKLREYAERMNCSDYDFLFLVPSEMVSASDGFIKKREFEKRGIQLFDGTIKSNRDKGYPETGLSQCRVYNYASCRGLEGWVTVCFRFDALIEEKLGNNPSQEIVSQTYLWSLMPLTRAVDRLIITLRNPNSHIGQVLKQIADNESIVWDIDD